MGSRALTRHVEESVEDDTTIEAVYCLGNCACAPAVMINNKTIGRVDAQRFDSLMTAMRETNS